MAVGEAPSEEIAMVFVKRLNALGNVRTTTANAFTKEEFAGMVNKCYKCFAGLKVCVTIWFE